MEKYISIILAFFLALRIEMVFSEVNDTFEASNEVVRDEYYDVFAENIETSEAVQLACSSKCVQVGEDCTRFHYRADHKVCTITKLKREMENSGGHTAPLMRYFHRKSISLQRKKRVSTQLIYWYSYKTFPRKLRSCSI